MASSNSYDILVIYALTLLITSLAIPLTCTTRKVSKCRVFSGPYFPAFGLNTERYGVSLRIQSECGEIPTRKNFVFGQFSRSDTILVIITL